MTYQQHSSLLPNVVIVSAIGRGSVPFISSVIPDIQLQYSGQCFPLYWYEKQEPLGGLFEDEASSEYVRHDAITDEALSVFRKAYPQVFDRRKTKEGGEELTKEDLFYYIYGILHSPEYRSRFDANLKKELPRIPLAADFRAFSEAGRKLAHLHLNYETVEPWPLKETGDSITPGPVVKMTWGNKRGPSGKNVNDLSTIVYNKHLVLSGIPEEAHRYVVNGKSGLAWLLDRYRVTTDKASGIVNDPNEYSDDPRYIIDLIKRVTRVSVESMGIIDALPPLQEKDQPIDWPEAWKATSE